MAKRFTRNIRSIENIEKQPKYTNEQNDLLSDDKHVYIRNKDKYEQITGGVKEVNGETPDNDGSVEIDTGVMQVNGKDPNEQGNIDVDSGVKTVTNVEPDENGNVNLQLKDFKGQEKLVRKNQLDESDDLFEKQLRYTWNNLESFPVQAPENDDTERIKRMIEATNEGETVFIPYKEEWYNISDTIVINKRINVIIKGKIGYTGERDRSAIKLDRLNGIHFELYKIADGNNASNDNETNYGGYHGWENTEYIGIEAINLKWCNIKVYEIRNFTTGFKASADGGNGYWFNKHYLLNTINNLRHIEINSNGDESWFNANYFYETSIGYGTSHTPFLNDNRMKYGILQTLTNGNEYGGNSNIFYDFKFEADGDFPYGFTQIKTVLAKQWRFENYRQEINGSNLHLLEVDLSYVNEDIVTSGAHTNGITLKPFSIFGSNQKIKFTNTDKVRSSYPHIASFDNWKDELYTKLVLNDLHKQARKTTINELVIPNLIFTQTSNKDVHHERISNYGGEIQKDYINIKKSYPLLTYIENIKKGDTFIIEIDSYKYESGNFNIESFRSTGEKIEGLEVDGVRPIAFYGDFSQDYLILKPHQVKGEYHFTVNADFVDTIRLNFAGTLNNIRIKTDNENAIVKTTQKDVKPNKIYFNSKPSLTVEGGFKVGDTVYSQNENIGWSLENNSGSLEWVEFTY